MDIDRIEHEQLQELQRKRREDGIARLIREMQQFTRTTSAHVVELQNSIFAMAYAIKKAPDLNHKRFAEDFRDALRLSNVDPDSAEGTLHTVLVVLGCAASRPPSGTH